MENNLNENAVITKKKRFPIWAVIAAAVVILAASIGGTAIARTGSVEKKVAKQLELARKYVSELNYICVWLTF